MVMLDNKEHVYIGDIVVLQLYSSELELGKVYKFIEVTIS